VGKIKFLHLGLLPGKIQQCSHLEKYVVGSPTYFVCLLDKEQYLKLTESCYLIFNVCFIYQSVYTSSWS